MCGIFYTFGTNHSDQELEKHGKLISHRGPDDMSILRNGKHYFMFHRLKINDLTNAGNQPFNIGGCILICNGEIYNFKQLALDLSNMNIGYVKWLGTTPTKIMNSALDSMPPKPQGDGWNTVYELKVSL